MPQSEAGMRTEPPVSEPRQNRRRPPRPPAADPLDEPPGMRPGARMFVGVP